MLRVTLAVLWCATGSCTVSSPGARAALCLTTRAFTPKSAPCCPGLTTFSPDIAKLSSSCVGNCTEEGRGNQRETDIKGDRDKRWCQREEQQAEWLKKGPQGKTVGKREKEMKVVFSLGAINKIYPFVKHQCVFFLMTSPISAASAVDLCHSSPTDRKQPVETVAINKTC